MNQRSDLAIIAGLGNPGRQYASTRHNVGFMIVDDIARDLGGDAWRDKFGASYFAAMDRGLILVKPMEFMNDSGPPLRSLMGFYRVPPERVLVVSDDLDIPLGKLRMRPHGGHGGHNGLRSIIEHVGSLFPRLRVGIGRQPQAGEQAVISRVLGDFAENEQSILKPTIRAAHEGALLWQSKGADAAMRFLNTWQVLQQ